MRQGDVILTLQRRHGSTCGQHAGDVRLFVFYLSLGMVRVYEINRSHMGKNNGNPNRSQTCNCKKGSDWLKRSVEVQHNIFSCKVFHEWSIIKLRTILYLLEWVYLCCTF